MKNFKLETLFLTIFITLLSQISIAQIVTHNLTGTIMDGSNIIIRVGHPEIQIPITALNYDFYLSYMALEQIYILNEDYDYSQYVQPFIDAGLVFLDDRYRLTPLIYVVVTEDKEAVDYLVEEAKVNLDLVDSNGMTALMWTVVIGNEDIVRSLVDAGANIEVAFEYPVDGNHTDIITNDLMRSGAGGFRDIVCSNFPIRCD